MSTDDRGPIQKWSTFRTPFMAPELPPCVQGVFADGRHIKTSCIVRTEGRFVFTENGSRYELGEPDPPFVEWLTSNDYQFDPEHPIRLVKKFTQLSPPTDQAPHAKGEDKG